MKKLLIGALIVTSLGCSPKFYIIDRQTMLEDEAAAEWPDFEKDLLDRTEAQGPTPFATEASSASETRKGRLYKVLNGELGAERGKTSP